MSINLESRYVTNDGEEFTTREKAEQHVTDVCCEILDKRFPHEVLREKGFSRTDTFKFITTLIPNYDALCHLVDDLARMTGGE